MRMLLLLRLLLSAIVASSSNAIGVETGVDSNDRAQVEAGLLSLLGLEKRPKPQLHDKPASSYVPDQLKRLYHQQKTISELGIAKPGIHVRSSNTVRTFSHVESPVDEKFKSADKFRLLFDVSSVVPTETLHAAQLVLNRVPLLNQEGGRNVGRLLVYDILEPGVRSTGKKPSLRLLDSKLVNTRSNGTVDLDVEPAVQRWLAEGPKRNHGLLVQLQRSAKSKTNHTQGHLRLRRSLDDDATWGLQQPILYTYSDDGKNAKLDAKSIVERRAKRAAQKHGRKRDGRGNCRRHQLYVDFADVGWNDWIVAPPGYEAFYCHGDCPFPLTDHLNSTNHAIVQNLVYSINPSIVPKACCVPTALSSISMLYLDEENKVVLKNYQDMAVLGCGCR